MLTRQIEFKPPEKQTNILEVPVTFIEFSKVSLHLYSMFFKRQSLQMGSFLWSKADGFVLHFLQMATSFLIFVFYSSAFCSYFLAFGSQLFELQVFLLQDDS